MLGVATIKNISCVVFWDSSDILVFYIGQSVTYYVKGQIVNNLGFVSYMVSVVNTQLSPCSPQTAIDST